MRILKSLQYGLLITILGIVATLTLVGLGIFSLHVLGCWGIVTWPILLSIFIFGANYYVNHQDDEEETQTS